MRRHGFWILAGLAVLPTLDASVPVLPVSAFFSKPELLAPELSPDGSHIAFLAQSEGAMNLFVMDMAKAKLAKLSGFADYDVVEFAWLNERRLVLAAGKDGWHLGGIYAIDADNTRRRTLVESAESFSRQIRTSWALGTLGWVGGPPSEDLLVSLRRDDRGVHMPDVYRVRSVSGRRSLVLRNPGNYTDWWADNQARVRLVTAISGSQLQILHRATEQEDFRLLATTDLRDELLSPIGFHEDNVRVWCYSNRGRDTVALCLLDTVTGEISEPLHHHPLYDLGPLEIDQWSGRVHAWHVVTATYESHYLDPAETRLIAQVKASFPGNEVDIVSRTADGRIRVLQVWSDRDPGRFYIHDTSRKGLEVLGVGRPGIDPAHMVPMTPIRLTARDGLALEGYVFRPHGSAGRPAPMVVVPHGGPQARDLWGFDAEAQFLANRGYVVLKVNFRGSSGYGKKFMQAGYRQWGLAMQDDISDAVRWAIAEGIADPARIAIYGASYGGFAALAGASFTPELYACAASYVGVTDISLLFIDRGGNRGFLREALADYLGDPETEADYIRRVSPVYHVEKVRVPLLLAWGAKDWRVDMKHADRYIAELKKHKKQYELMIEPGEGHGFRKQEAEIEFYTRLEAFFAKHLK